MICRRTSQTLDDRTIDVRGILGHPSMKDVDHSIVILNRLVTWTDKGIEMEADPRHVDLLLQ